MMRRCHLLLIVSVGSLVLTACSAPPAEDNRSIDGDGNHPDGMGRTFVPLARMAPVAYMDGVAMPARMDMPSPRALSNALCSQTGLTPNDRGLSDWVWQWGQFIDHDITLSEFMLPVEPLPIMVPMGDVMFDPAATGAMMIPMDRSVYDPATGTGSDNPRQQVNQLTAFIDGSQVYGSDDSRAAWLRLGIGGRLRTSPGDMLPFNDGTQGNAGPGGQPSFSTALFTAGDIRANEQPGLTAVHTLFVREHNRLADELAAEHPEWSDEVIYQRARKMVGALIQVVTYHEFLPAIFGPHAPDPEAAVYDPAVDPRIANEFANACFRFGHTMLSPMIQRLDDSGRPVGAGAIPLRDGFFNPRRFIDEGGIEPLLRGLAAQPMQEIDGQIVDDVRSFLFGAPGQGGFDLAALNMQRGRDHGLADYNTLREAYGLPRVNTFAEINPDPDVQARFAEVYDDPHNIDPWIGAMWETHLDGTSAGPLLTAVIVDQFERLRDGDRFWYAHDPAFTDADIAELKSTRLSDIIRRNTTITQLPDAVFHVEP